MSSIYTATWRTRGISGAVGDLPNPQCQGPQTWVLIRTLLCLKTHILTTSKAAMNIPEQAHGVWTDAFIPPGYVEGGWVTR